MLIHRSVWRSTIALCLAIVAAALVGIGVAVIAQPAVVPAPYYAADATEPVEQAIVTPTPAVVQPSPAITFFSAAEATPTVEPTPLVAETFDTPNQQWITRSTSTASSAYVDGAYQLQLIDQADIGVTHVLPTPSYRLSVDLRVEEGNAGLILFAVKPTTFYRLLFSPQGRFALQLQDQATGNAQYLIDWTTPPSTPEQVPAVQHVVVERGTTTVRIFVNNQPIGEFALPEGNVINQYGFVLESATKRGLATFDNLVVGQIGQ